MWSFNFPIRWDEMNHNHVGHDWLCRQGKVRAGSVIRYSGTAAVSLLQWQNSPHWTYGVMKAALINPLITHEVAGETVWWELTEWPPHYRDTHNRSNCGKYTGTSFQHKIIIVSSILYLGLLWWGLWWGLWWRWGLWCIRTRNKTDQAAGVSQVTSSWMICLFMGKIERKYFQWGISWLCGCLSNISFIPCLAVRTEERRAVIMMSLSHSVRGRERERGRVIWNLMPGAVYTVSTEYYSQQSPISSPAIAFWWVKKFVSWPDGCERSINVLLCFYCEQCFIRSPLRSVWEVDTGGS